MTEPHDDCNQTQTLISSITAYVSNQMSNNDPSHNPAHVSRVVSLALTLLSSEEESKIKEKETTPQNQSPYYDKNLIHLSALLHDIADKKYLPQPHLDPATGLVRSVLLEHGADPSLAEKVQVITSHVSYSAECKDPERVAGLVRVYPELGIVQDADRLDAIGAVGIGRCFTFLGAKGKGKGKGKGDGEEWELENAIRHFGEKLERLEGMMKTESGREMARVRTERLRVFKGWWEEETGVGSGGGLRDVR